jgi:hypothetical protein
LTVLQAPKLSVLLKLSVLFDGGWGLRDGMGVWGARVAASGAGGRRQAPGGGVRRRG